MRTPLRMPAFSLPILLILLLRPAAPAAAQPVFTEVTPTANPYFVTPEEEDFWLSSLAPADVDGDGDLDFAAIGFYVVYNESVDHHLLLFLNQGPDPSGNWTFANVEVPLGRLSSGSSDLAWGDYDNDGDEDLAVGSNGATAIYRNDAGTLSALPNLLPGYDEDAAFSSTYDLRSITWADYDNDADLDLLLPSVYDPSSGFTSVLLRNDGPDGGGGWIFTDAQAAIDAAAHAQSAWADEDGDGDLDLLLQNIAFDGKESFLKLFRNGPSGFVGEPLLDFSDLDGMTDWADADADGDLDVLVVGNLQEADGTYHTVLRIYRNEGGGSFTPITLAEGFSADWLDLLAATWADYDSDGDVDVLATGSFIGGQKIEGHSKIFANDGNTWSALPLELPAPVSSVGRGGAFTWLDLDGDGDLDYLVGGAYYVPGGNGLVEAKLKLYRNGAAAVNQPPSAPTGLDADPLQGGAVRLTWNAATDDHTAAAALTYDLEVRRLGAPAVAARLPPQPGNLSRADSWQLELPPGTYAYSLCAVDSALNPGAKATGTFTVPAAANVFADGFETGGSGRWFMTVP